MVPNMSDLNTDIINDISHAVTDDGDHDRFAHYVLKDEITEAIVNGLPVIALCGKIWIPSRDPEKYPICPRCKELFSALGNF